VGNLWIIKFSWAIPYVGEAAGYAATFGGQNRKLKFVAVSCVLKVMTKFFKTGAFLVVLAEVCSLLQRYATYCAYLRLSCSLKEQ